MEEIWLFIPCESGAAHPETSYYIRYRGAVYADTGNFNRCIRLWMYALEMQQSMLEPLSPMTNSSLLSFAELFSFMMAERDSETRNNNNGRILFHLPYPFPNCSSRLILFVHIFF